MYDYIKETDSFLVKLYESEICTEYCRQRELIKQYPELKAQIDEFRKRNFMLQNKADSATLFDEIDRFEKEFEEFRKNPLVSAYLEAELAFCRMYQDISSMINTAFAMEVD